MPTIKDVAEAAGVSVATVSYVLNGTKRVSPEVEARVRQIADMLDYQPNAKARNLRMSENRIIGYELPFPVPGDISSLMQRFAYELTIAAAKAGYHLMTFAAIEPQTIVEAYETLIRADRVDGFVVSNTNWRDERIVYLNQMQIPFVAFGRTQPGIDMAYVDVDGYDGLRQVVMHLLNKGHQRIAFIGWPEGSFSGDNRLKGYVETLQSVGIVPMNPYIQRGENRVEVGYAAAERLMNLPNPPTAIACVSDIVAIGAIRFLNQHGEKVAVTGFDDIPLANYVTPSLTTVTQPISLVEEHLINILLHEIQGNPVPNRQIVLKPTLAIRESTSFDLRET